MSTCQSCRFFERQYQAAKPNEPPEPMAFGICHRHAPTIIPVLWVGSPPPIAQPGQPPVIRYDVHNFGSYFPVVGQFEIMAIGESVRSTGQ